MDIMVPRFVGNGVGGCNIAIYGVSCNTGQCKQGFYYVLVNPKNNVRF